MAQCPKCGKELKVVQTCCSTIYWCDQCEQEFTPKAENSCGCGK